MSSVSGDGWFGGGMYLYLLYTAHMYGDAYHYHRSAVLLEGSPAKCTLWK
jgi:hypothetical protein